MTRLKTYALAALTMIVSLAALGLFASVGLAVLGILVFLGIASAAVAWIATVMGPKQQTLET